MGHNGAKRMIVRPLAPTGPKVGALLPDFTVETLTGRMIHRREFKGRKHLVVCFAPVGREADGQALAAAIAVLYPSWQAERAESLLIVTDPAGFPTAPTSPPIVSDADGQLRARFGVGAEAALFIADRYGEIALYATYVDTTATQGLPLDDVLPTLELLEMRCSL
jgi:alkyl hydroperoxide reductase subunit AhpC